ncbi:unnamed protein product [Periconia digitata]|uniref:Aquaporin-like protein n=1 Tax=Periconia digitata TaxID=1303443 RepID=A0A9W4XGE5_9PLEO|nr:unnamed protein product [Periconia digitata]
MSAREEQAADGNRPQQRRTFTSSSRNQSNLQHRNSMNSTRPARPERQTSYGSFQTQNDSEAPNNNNNVPSAQESRWAHAYANSLSKQQTEKKTDNRFYVDNDYFDLNPWYDEEPKKPVFGMGRPFPRTVRPGMLWGRSRAQAAMNEQGKEEQGSDSTANRPILHIPMNENDESPPDAFDAEIGGNFYEVQRRESNEQGIEDDKLSAGIDREDHAPDNNQGLNRLQSQTRNRYISGYSGGLPPVDETASLQSYESYQTEADKKQARQHDEQALQDYYNNYRNPLARLRAKYPEAPAEFLCTMIYVFFGITGSLYSTTYPAAQGDYATQGWAWGMAVMAGIYVGGGVSGAHMSPWISVCFSVFRGFPWKMTAVYSAAQILGGLAAGGLSWAIYRDGIMNVDPQLTPTKSGMAFYSTPPDYVSLATAFFNNFISAAFYVCIAFAIGDDANTPPGAGMTALIYGLLTYLLTITMGYNGLGISPARDLGPRFVAWWAGYGSTTFSTGWWAYGPILAGLSGSLVGALVYDVLIFAGGESPVNYTWPTTQDVKNRILSRKDEAKQKAQEVSV